MEMQILSPTHGRLVGGRALDYLDHFDANLDDEKEMIFEVKDRKRAGLGLVGMWAFEAWTPGYKTPVWPSETSITPSSRASRTIHCISTTTTRTSRR